MRRTQLYLDDDLWSGLHTRARQEGTTISELVRAAVRERYLAPADTRKKAMQSVVGIWKNRQDVEDTEAYVRGLRRGTRLTRLAGK
jgi:hypothetical protein